MSYLKSKTGSVEEVATAIAAKNQTILTKLEARTPDQQKAFDKQMKDFIAKGGKIQKIPAGKKTDPNKLKKGIKEDVDKIKKGNDKSVELTKEIWGARKASGGKHGDKKFKKAEHEPKGNDLEEKDGANTSSRQGSRSRGAKKKYRFGYRVAEKQPKGNDIEEAKEDDKGGASTAKVPPVKSSDKPGTKIAKIRLKRDKMDGKDGGKQEDPEALKKTILSLQGQVNVLKARIENEKNKVIKPQPNKETGEVPLTIGVAYKHLRDKMKKESLEIKINELNERLNEGYEGNILYYLKDKGISAEFRHRKLFVAKKAADKTKKILQKGVKDRGSVIAYSQVPPIMTEDETKTLTGRKPTKVDTEPKISYSR